ncbi:MAG TPA: hypothetical protein VJ111_01790 [Chitinophagaceae bacterium]|nr:hypothetical protein [Chitinophagaceae bacterium]
MKTILAAMCFLAVIGCNTGKEIQVEMVQAELIRIDTLFRQSNNRKLLTWRDQNNIEYISFVSMNHTYPLGISMIVMRAR